MVSEKSHRISPSGGQQANYSALRRCVTSYATVLSCRSPTGWRWWRIQPACYWLSGRNPKFNRHLANMRTGVRLRVRVNDLHFDGFSDRPHQADQAVRRLRSCWSSWLSEWHVILRKILTSSAYTRSITNVSRVRFTHSRQNGTLAESRSEEGSLTGSSAQSDTWRIPHSSPPFQPGTHTDRAITARGEGPRPAVFRPICCVPVHGRDGRGWGGGHPLEGFASNWTTATIKKTSVLLTTGQRRWQLTLMSADSSVVLFGGALPF